MPPSPPSGSATAPRRSVLRRIAKWLAWCTGIFTLLMVLFLTIPGIECDLRLGGKGTVPWLCLLRKKNPGDTEMRGVKLGGAGVAIELRDSTQPLYSPRSRGPNWENGTLFYTGSHWRFLLQFWDP